MKNPCCGVHFCLNCGNTITYREYVYHCMINGNDYDFCSEKCIKEYSKNKKCTIVLVEKFLNQKIKEKIKVMLI
jgi:YHS domain-containing protein